MQHLCEFQFHYWSDLYSDEIAQEREMNLFQFHYWSDLY